MGLIITDSDNYTNISNAIRDVSGSTQMIYPANMAGEISKLNHVENVKRWTVTVPENAESSVTMVNGDAWIAEHYADENLVICVVPKGTKKGAYRIFGGVFMSSSPLLETTIGETGYGVSLTNSGSAQTLSSSSKPASLQESDTVFSISVEIDGRIRVLTSTGYTIVAGEYSIIAWLM